MSNEPSTINGIQCSTRELANTDVVVGDGSELAAGLADANAAAGRYSAALLANELGTSLELADGTARSFEDARLIGPGVVGLIEHLVGTGTARAPTGHQVNGLNFAPDAVLRSVEADGLVVLQLVQQRHRFLRRLAEHLRRLGWTGVTIDVAILGPRGRLVVPAAPRALVVQAHGGSTFELSGDASSLQPAVGCAMAGVSAVLRSEGGIGVVVVAVAHRFDEPTGVVGAWTDLRARAHEPPASTATLGQVLHLERLAAAGSLDAMSLMVRGRHPAGAYALAGSGDQIACGGQAWRVPARLQTVVGRVLSGPPVSAQELGQLAGLGSLEAVSTTLGLIRCGLCEPCDPAEPLI